MRILLTSGGTGGHIFASVAVLQQLQKISEEERFFLDFMFLGPDKFPAQIKSKRILAGKLRRYFSLQNFIDFFKIIIGFWQTFWHIFWFMPDVVFGKGGYGSFLVILVSWLFRIPIIIHESDAVIGLTNKICSPLVKKITFSFPKSEKYFPEKKRILTGHPIREKILFDSKEKAKTLLKIEAQKPVIFFIGGSQGAKKINDLVLEILSDLLQQYEVLHQAGKSNFEEVKKEAEALFLAQKLPHQNYHLFAELSEEEIGAAYLLSDLIIARAGAGTIFEIAAVGKPSIFVPLPTAAKDHQVRNAYEFSEETGAIILEEANFTPHFVLQEIANLLEDKKRLAKISANAKKFAKPEAARTIAEEIIKLGLTTK